MRMQCMLPLQVHAVRHRVILINDARSLTGNNCSHTYKLGQLTVLSAWRRLGWVHCVGRGFRSDILLSIQTANNRWIWHVFCHYFGGSRYGGTWSHVVHYSTQIVVHDLRTVLTAVVTTCGRTFINILLLLLFKKVGNARLGESD